MGSVKGSPSSMRSNYDQQVMELVVLWFIPAPPASIPSNISTVSSAVGYPAVTYVTKAERFSLPHWANVSLMCSIAVDSRNIAQYSIKNNV